RSRSGARVLRCGCDAAAHPAPRLDAPRALAWLAAVQLPAEAQQTRRRLERLDREGPIGAQAGGAEVRGRGAREPEQARGRLERLAGEVPIAARAADAEVRARAATDPIAVALEPLVGIGPIMALTIRAETGHRARGARGRALGGGA